VQALGQQVWCFHRRMHQRSSRFLLCGAGVTRQQGVSLAMTVPSAPFPAGTPLQPPGTAAAHDAGGAAGERRLDVVMLNSDEADRTDDANTVAVAVVLAFVNNSDAATRAGAAGGRPRAAVGRPLGHAVVL
jgi:3D (Asp-Asp-Asp) domain-containing protein